MDVALHTIHSPVLICCRRSSKSPPSSSLPLCGYMELHIGTSRHKQEAFRNQKQYCFFPLAKALNGFPCIPKKHQAIQLHQSMHESNHEHFGCELHRRDKFVRSTVVRSELTGTGIPEADYPLSDIKLSSKVRGICFYAVTATAAIFLFVLMLVQHPFVLLLDRHRRKAQFFIAKIWATLSVTPFFKIKYEGLENLPHRDTPAVYVSNHQSFLDIFTLLTLGRSFKFISKTSIFLYPIIGWAMSMMGVIPLKRMDSRSQLDCLRRCMDVLKNGASVCFFPEGTRSKDGKLGTFKKGAFSVATKMKVPVVPMTIMGTGKILPAGNEGILNTGSVKVVIHKPIEGSNPELLCNTARDTIAEALNYG
ncbi:hypothetical protein K2173_021077 [Erythroxylum novogranatense]|uniref:1-acyl-sn-glycerol-3-phosphate acyltransferase n=1 Tax=Erythroxylum novogranatense TaxID=1862640 RepID=A0AAV8TMQ6_9ROSI|nr:hypothetical protein K2173_021077 [Erythroxylum novogranatense]